MRERGRNVSDVLPEREAIRATIERQVEHGPYPMEPIYGDGQAGTRIAEVLTKCRPSVQKRITY